MATFGGPFSAVTRVRFQKYERPIENYFTSHIGSLQRTYEAGRDTVVIALDPGYVTEEVLAELLAFVALSTPGSVLGPPATSEEVGLLVDKTLVGRDNTPLTRPEDVGEGKTHLLGGQAATLGQIARVFRDKAPHYECDLHSPGWKLINVPRRDRGGR
jgi:hypothetical protein